MGNFTVAFPTAYLAVGHDRAQQLSIGLVQVDVFTLQDFFKDIGNCCAKWKH